MRAACSMICLLVALVGPASSAAAAAEAELEPAAALERQLRDLNRTLGELVALLRQQVESGNATLLMQRVELMTSRIAPIEEELRSARIEERGARGELDELELSATHYAAGLERQVDEGEISAERARNLRRQQQPGIDQRQEQLEERLWAARQRVIDLEQRLAARRAEIETWEAEIDRALGLR